MAQSPHRKRPTRPSSVLLIALGAMAGVALGMLVADRLGGMSGVRRRGGRRREAGPDRLWNDGDGADAADELADDDSELAGESIAHIHVRPRGEHPDSAPEAMPDRLSTRERLRDRMRDRRTRSMEPEVAPAPVAAGHAERAPLADIAVTPIGPSLPTHEELESRVLEAFRNDPVLEVRAIDIGAVGSGTVELTGWVESTGEIAHALTLARGVPGVTAVVDHLAVRGPGANHSHRSAQYETPHRR